MRHDGNRKDAAPVVDPVFRRWKRSGRFGQAPLGEGGLLSGDALFLSDVHLVDPRDVQTKMFLNFLQSIGGTSGVNSGRSQSVSFERVQHVFLLGDIFEFIDASSEFFRELWRDVFDVLGLLRARGVHVYFVEGNHDFGFEYVRQRDLQTVSKSATDAWLQRWAAFVGDVGLEFEHPALGRVHIRHGDDVVAPKEYLYFRGFVKSRLAGFLLRRVPSRASHYFFIWLAKMSRKRGGSYALSFEKVRDDVLQFVSQGMFSRPDVFIIGHIHVFIDAKINGMRTLSGPDWYQAPSYLLLTQDGSIRRVFLDEGKRAAQLEPRGGGSATARENASSGGSKAECLSDISL